MFVDFRRLSDKFLIPHEIDYFENARRAVYVQQEYAIRNPNGWKGYDSLTWGLTACDGPGFDYNYDDKVFQYYAARGTSGPGRVDFDDGTIAPTASAASLPFAPEIVLPTIHNLYRKYGKLGLWGIYGFKDSFNPTLNWYAEDYLGIDQGPIVLMIENYKTGFVWKYFMNDSVIKKGLKVLGIEEN
jgi:hypothetical protein